ncbi:hypothetical protein SL1157_0416 [Ruegeria lacuscaerulensis ITI-1157]|nr:hypothetical protein SL1157_0416 [Ruegeria lacuscaerulensis ITI-1157]
MAGAEKSQKRPDTLKPRAIGLLASRLGTVRNAHAVGTASC